LGYDLSNCDRDAYEGILATYGYCIEIFYATFIVIFAVIAWIKEKNRTERKKIALLAFGITLFLLSFSIGNIVQVFTDNYYVDQYGLFGAPIFTAFLAYLIVRFKAFNLRLIGAQALVVALWLMVLALLFIPNINYIRIVTSITLIFVLILGILLVRGVNREIKQRERIELLAKDLEVANKQQIVLIHFITHQIKGFVTKSRNIFSMIMEGDLGPVPDAMRPMVEEGFRSDTKGANTIQEILNAANIRNGKVAYANDSYDLKELTEEIIKDLKPAADTKGLALTFAAEGESFTTIGDRMQMQNALKNLIDNSIKYTPSGSVAVSLKKEDGKIHFEIRDTGIGITEEDMQHLFTEGGHGKESQKVNVDSTGFGLFIVKNIIEAHHGKVWAESEGEGKGSQFIVELPA
ncbi:MAG: Two-component system, NarL family, sensor histidine kinase BarA, partial [Parcubacteria group bacterium]|nr:Two-component system, NarL family, sensor histidine kinase BarA [Parcubacteria group bacterium]